MNVSSKPERDTERFSLAGMLHHETAFGVIVVDAKKTICSITSVAEQWLGLIPGQSVGAAVDVLPAALRRMVTSTKTAKDRAVTVTTASGEEIPLQVTTVPLNGRKPEAGTVLILTAAADGQFDQKIRRLDRLAGIGKLSANTAHEIKNALVAVRTFVELLLEKNKDAELADVVQREMQRITTMVNQTLKYAVPGRPTMSTVTVHDVLDHSLRIVQPHFEKKLITLKRQFHAAHSAVRGDDFQLEQVFVNLFLNAVDATGASGTLTVTTELVPTPVADPVLPAEGGLCLSVMVADTGVGIAPENMRRLFEPFFTTKENGTGLGLAITQRIVEEHHGCITAESEPNQGTTFRLLFPVQAGKL